MIIKSKNVIFSRKTSNITYECLLSTQACLVSGFEREREREGARTYADDLDGNQFNTHVFENNSVCNELLGNPTP